MTKLCFNFFTREKIKFIFTKNQKLEKKDGSKNLWEKNIMITFWANCIS